MEVQATAQKVARENELLRRLLRSVGFDDKFQDEYIRSELQELTSEGAQVAVSPAQPPDLPGLECEERAVCLVFWAILSGRLGADSHGWFRRWQTSP